MAGMTPYAHWGDKPIVVLVFIMLVAHLRFLSPAVAYPKLLAKLNRSSR
jgi:hypothetical protein